MAGFRALVALGAAFCLAGCVTSSGEFPGQSDSRVDLSKANFRVLKAGAVGTSYGFKLLGIFPLAAPHYSTAMQDLRSQAPMEGRAAAVANVTQDNSSLYLILFSIPKITVSGDIIEFTGPPSGGN